jgi:putative colanic acid biosynthesis acetyltransferase WcaF
MIPAPETQGGSADIAANRRARKYSSRELLRRTLWALVVPAFRLSPRPFFAWRRFLLRLFGAQIGCAVNVYGSAVITMPWNLDIGDWSALGEGVLIYNLGPVSIGSRVTVSQRAHLCAGTHDHTRRDMPLLKPPIRVDDDAWVCADVFIGPGVTVGAGAVVGARAVVVKDVPAWTVVAGNPARTLGPRLPEGRWSE